jgi:putative endonuclease
MFFVYILKSEKDGRTYVGFCENIEKRLNDHNSGKVDATRNRRPLEILFLEKLNNLETAKIRERYWKSGAGRRKLKHFFEKGFPPIQK